MTKDVLAYLYNVTAAGYCEFHKDPVTYLADLKKHKIQIGLPYFDEEGVSTPLGEAVMAFLHPALAPMWLKYCDRHSYYFAVADPTKPQYVVQTLKLFEEFVTGYHLSTTGSAFLKDFHSTRHQAASITPSNVFSHSTFLQVRHNPSIAPGMSFVAFEHLSTPTLDLSDSIDVELDDNSDQFSREFMNPLQADAESTLDCFRVDYRGFTPPIQRKAISKEGPTVNGKPLFLDSFKKMPPHAQERIWKQLSGAVQLFSEYRDNLKRRRQQPFRRYNRG